MKKIGIKLCLIIVGIVFLGACRGKVTTGVLLTVTPSPQAVPTNGPSPTPDPALSPTPTETPSPAPTVDPVSLVTNGWQSVEDITQSYLVVFPEVFCDSTVNRTEKELTIQYTSSSEPICFQVIYRMRETYETAMEGLLSTDAVVLEENISERRFSYCLEDDIMLHQGIVIETQYSKGLIGDGFGDEENIIGIMQVIYSYPKNHREEYEEESFRFFVVEVP